jgi:hypothetical protein
MNNDLTELIVILDASGSMMKRKQDVIGGFNQLIDEQRLQPGRCIITVVQFSSFGKQRTIVNRKPPYEVAYLVDADYRPGGWTALHDALGSVIDEAGTQLANLPESDRPGKVIVAVITDGEENHSQEYTVSQVRDKVQHQRDTYSWEFLFTGANQDAVLKGGSLGVSAGLSATYRDTARGYRKAMRGVSHATSALRQDDAEGACLCMKGIHTEEWDKELGSTPARGK